MATSHTQKIPWAKLPKQIRELLSAEETVDILEGIGTKYGLSEMECGFLMRVTGKLINGTLPPTAFVKSIVEDIDIDRDQAILMAQEINRDLFNQIKDLLKDIYDVGVKKPEIPVELTPAHVLTTLPPPIVKPTNQPVRSDWGWHGTKNETTGKIEFKHEVPLPEALTKNAPQGDTAAGAPHVGSIFEQKLGGVFTIKTDTPRSMEQKTPTPPQPSTPAPQAIQNLKTPTESPRSPALTALHVPKKPTQIPIPPVQVFQLPKS